MCRQRDRWFLFAIVVAVGLGTASAVGQPVPRSFVDMTYEVDTVLHGCPNGTEFRSMVALQLGYDPYREGAPGGLRVRLRPSESGIGGTIDWSTPNGTELGERRFSARSDECLGMMTTVAFVVAVQLQLMAVEQETEPPVPVNDAASTRREGDVVPNSEVPQGGSRWHNSAGTMKAPTLESFEVRPSSKTNANQWSGNVGGGLSMAIGLGPNAAAQGRLFVAVRSGHLLLEVGGEETLKSTAHQDYGAGFEHELTMGTLAVCGERYGFFLCALGKMGQIRVKGLELDKPASPKGFLAQLGPRLAYAHSLGDHLVLQGHIEALYLPVTRTVVLNQLAVWTTPRFSAIAGIDLAAQF